MMNIPFLIFNPLVYSTMHSLIGAYSALLSNDCISFFKRNKYRSQTCVHNNKQPFKVRRDDSKDINVY